MNGWTDTDRILIALCGLLLLIALGLAVFEVIP